MKKWNDARKIILDKHRIKFELNVDANINKIKSELDKIRKAKIDTGIFNEKKELNEQASVKEIEERIENIINYGKEFLLSLSAREVTDTSISFDLTNEIFNIYLPPNDNRRNSKCFYNNKLLKCFLEFAKENATIVFKTNYDQDFIEWMKKTGMSLEKIIFVEDF